MRGNEVEMRKTKIICTIGPACEGEERLRELMLAGMNVARFNFSHGSHEEHKVKFERVNKISGELGLPVATLLDTKGPEIRLKTIENGRTELTRGQKFVLTTEEVIGNSERVSITYKNLKNDVSVGTTILIDDGLIEMVVDEIDETDIICTVVNGGPISNNKGVNVPGASLSMPYISDVDRSDIMFGCDMGFDYLAASFVRCREDILEVRGILKECGSNMKIIAKIENMQGIRNLDEILEASDGIMVARGDMGVEIPMEEVPVVQKRMIKNPRPTRAETTDIANAIYDGTTAIMLSGESAAGLYPVEAVRTMARIAERTEQDINYRGRMKSRTEIDTMDITTAISHATCTTAMDLQAAAIITVTISGFTAGMIAKYKPQCPIIACSVSPGICRQLNLYWGVTPVWIKRENCAEDLFEKAVHAAEEAGYIKKGDRVVLTAGVPLGVSGNTNMIRVVEV